MSAEQTARFRGNAQKSPRWFHGWNIVSVGATSQLFVVGLSTGCFSMFVLPLEEELNASRFAITLIYSFLFLGMVIFSPVVQLLIKKTSIRTCLMTGAVSLITGLLLLSISQGVFQVIIIYAVLMAVANTFGGAIPCSTLVVNWFDRLRGRAMGFSTVGASLGGFLTPPMAAYLIDSAGWRATYFLFAILSAVVLIPIILWVISDTPQSVRLRPDGDADSPSEEPAENSTTADSLSVIEILRCPVYWLMVIFFGLGIMIYKGILVNFVPIAIERGFDSIQAAYLISAMTACMIVGKILIGAAADKTRSHTLVLFALLLCTAGAVILAAFSNLTSLVVASILLGIGNGGFFPLLGIFNWRKFSAKIFR